MFRPVLSNSCARANTTEEARFRIDYPLAAARATRVVALDGPSSRVVAAAAKLEWHHARFFVAGPAEHDLRLLDGRPANIAEELDGVDAVILVASSNEGAKAAASIGAACTVRGVMTAGLVLDSAAGGNGPLTALRPHARIIMVPADQEDLVELLRAIRA